MAGHVTTLFGYLRGLNGVLVAKLFEALERNNQAVNSIGRIADDGLTCEQPQKPYRRRALSAERLSHTATTAHST